METNIRIGVLAEGELVNCYVCLAEWRLFFREVPIGVERDGHRSYVGIIEEAAELEALGAYLTIDIQRGEIFVGRVCRIRSDDT